MTDIQELPVFAELPSEPMHHEGGPFNTVLLVAEAATADAAVQSGSELVEDQPLDVITDGSNEAAEGLAPPEDVDARDISLRGTIKLVQRWAKIRNQSGDSGSTQGSSESGGAEEQDTNLPPASGGRGGEPPDSGEPPAGAFSEDPGDEPPRRRTEQSHRDQPGDVFPDTRKGRRRRAAVARAEYLRKEVGVIPGLTKHNRPPAPGSRHRRRGRGTWAAIAASGLAASALTYAGIHYGVQKAVPNPQRLVPPSVLEPVNPIEGKASPDEVQQEIGRLTALTNADTNLATDLLHDGVFSKTFKNKRGNWVSVLKVAMGTTNGETESVTVISKDKSPTLGANLKPQPDPDKALQFHGADFTEFGGQAFSFSVNEGKTLATVSSTQSSTVRKTFEKNDITTILGQGTTWKINTRGVGHRPPQIRQYPVAVTSQLNGEVSKMEAEAADVLKRAANRIEYLDLHPPGEIGGQPPFTVPESVGRAAVGAGLFSATNS